MAGSLPPYKTGRDPIERWSPFVGRMLALFLSGLLLYEVASTTWSFPPLTPPFFYGQWRWWIITPLHEGGHFISFLFGRTLYIFGGSFWQVAFPLLLAGVALKQRSFWACVYTTIGGVHLIDLNPYIFDAPFRSLPLLGGSKVGHDWYNLLIHWQMLDSAEDLASIAYFGGLAIGIIGLTAGIVWAVILLVRQEHTDSAAPVPAKSHVSRTTPLKEKDDIWGA